LTGIGKHYDVIYADPPWKYSDSECLQKSSMINGGDGQHYPAMSLDELKAIDISRMASDNSIIFLWVVSPLLPEALELMLAWGFSYATVGFVWYKQLPNPGHYTMSECEICLIGRKGNIPKDYGSRNVRQFLSEKRKEHSRKPSEIRRRITEMFPNLNKIELFARERIEGWDCWGNEIPTTTQSLLRIVWMKDILGCEE